VPELPTLDAGAIVDAVARDKKKAVGGATRFVLLRAIGETVPDATVDREAIRSAFRFLETARK
jgi:3-dehydroquinate synthetase